MIAKSSSSIRRVAHVHGTFDMFEARPTDVQQLCVLVRGRCRTFCTGCFQEDARIVEATVDEGFRQNKVRFVRSYVGMNFSPTEAYT